MYKIIILLAIVLHLATGQAAVFGVDDRLVITPGAPQEKLGRSTAVAVLSALFTPEDELLKTFEIFPDPLNEVMCIDEKFSNLTSLSYACSGFLVGPDLLVTAGHCMVNTGETKNETEMFCDAYSWLFDYQADVSGKVKTKNIASDKLYHCKQIIYAVKDENAPFRDYAIIQLDRPVTDREPLKLSSEPLAVGAGVEMIGYPLGAPMIYSGNAKVLFDNPERESFITNLDAFDGNSGSAVFNKKGEVVGILIGGTPVMSLLEDTKAPNRCSRYNKCDDVGKNCTLDDTAFIEGWEYNGAGSEVQRIAPLMDLLKP